MKLVLIQTQALGIACRSCDFWGHPTAIFASISVAPPTSASTSTTAPSTSASTTASAPTATPTVPAVPAITAISVIPSVPVIALLVREHLALEVGSHDPEVSLGVV